MRLPFLPAPAPAIDLTDAVVVITGAARGIGLATAKAFAAQGARVCLGDLDGDLVAEAARAIGPQAHPFTVNVTSRASYAAFVEAVETTVGPIEILVNNAGVMPLGRFLDEPDAISDTTLDVNVRGVVHGMRLVLPGMIGRGYGHVVNVASMLGKLPAPGAAVYAASKYAVVGLTASVRDELAGTGVTVSAVLPTAVRTGLTAGVLLGRGMPTVDPEDIARAVVGSVHSRAAEIPVPWWLAGYEPLAALVPGPLMSLFRKALRADRALTSLDHEVRKTYEDRVAGQAATGRAASPER